MEQPGGKGHADRFIFNRGPVRNEPGSQFRAPTFQRQGAKGAKAAERQNAGLSSWRLRELCPLALTGAGSAVQSPVCFVRSREQARQQSCADRGIFNLGLNRLPPLLPAGPSEFVETPLSLRLVASCVAKSPLSSSRCAASLLRVWPSSAAPIARPAAGMLAFARVRARLSLARKGHRSLWVRLEPT
jgi:hypothetical protein